MTCMAANPATPALPLHAIPDKLHAMTDLAQLSDSELFLNRELSQLEFNFRVLAQAEDPAIPLF